MRECYADFGPTLAAEKLSERYGLDLGVEMLRQWMIGAGLWVRRKDWLKRIHQPRAQRDCVGELVQIAWQIASTADALWYSAPSLTAEPILAARHRP